MSNDDYPTAADCADKFTVPALSLQYVVVDTVGCGSSCMFDDYTKAVEHAIGIIKPHTDILASWDGVEPLTHDQILYSCTGLRLSSTLRAGNFVFSCLAYPEGPRCMVLELSV